MNAADIRDLYRDFFVARGHLAGEPAGLVPAGDASVLFTTAGMQQYKPYFLGVETPPATRITTCQRSFRTSDVENVGKTARHLTFFEMLGNFSFGDYFKAEAIEWALELSDQLGIDRSKVWVSVFGGDAQVPADEEARRAVEVARLHRRPHRPSRARRQLLGPGRTYRPLRALLRAVLRLRPRDGLRRPGLQAGLRLRPLPRVLEPRVRAVRHGRGAATSRPWPRGASTPGWASSASPASRRASPTCSRPTSSRRWWRRARSWRASSPRPRPPSPAPCARWPSTRAARRSSSWTASCPATTAATTCSGASSAAPSSRPWRSAWRSPSSRRSPTPSSSRCAARIPASRRPSLRSAAS